jgi:hypothetical protein
MGKNEKPEEYAAEFSKRDASYRSSLFAGHRVV